MCSTYELGGNFNFCFIMFSPKATGHAISILISKFKTGGSFVLVFKKKKAIQ